MDIEKLTKDLCGLHMSKTKTCTIRISNKSYEIKCPESETDSLEQAAQKLNHILTEKKHQFYKLDDYQLLLLAALHLSHELITSQKEQNLQRQQLTRLINSLETKINQATSLAPTKDA